MATGQVKTTAELFGEEQQSPAIKTSAELFGSAAPKGRVPLEMPKRPGALSIIGDTLKATGQDIIAPVEAAVRTAAGIPAFLAGTAATLGGQAVTGSWEKGRALEMRYQTL